MSARAAVALAALILLGGFRRAPVMADGISTEAGSAPNPLRSVDKSVLTGFRQHPLFEPLRQEAMPPEQPAPSTPLENPPPQPEPPPSLHLVGMVNGMQNLAIVRLDSATSTTVLSTGDKVGRWIATVTSTGLSLRDQERVVTFSLFAGSGHAGAAASSAPTPVGDSAP